MKTISFAIPCYNSAAYMEKCIESILSCGDDIEILIVNDGSTKDNTSEIAHAYEKRFPGIVRAIDQENRGHGGAVNHGLEEARGLYFKVVDSDDWLDVGATQVQEEKPCDLVIANYIYDKVDEGKKTVMSYTNVFPTDKLFTWEDIGRFRPSQYLLMHSVFYRTKVLKDARVQLPEHCFYVDNIFVYVPLPYVHTIRYFNLDVYHYYIGREDQSVNEKIMLSRIDQQLRITRFMIDEVNLEEVPDDRLRAYMYNYLSMMMCICSVFLRMEPTEENEQKRAEIWEYLRSQRPDMYAKVRGNIVNFTTNFPTPAGRALALGGYHLAQKIFKFN